MSYKLFEVTIKSIVKKYFKNEDGVINHNKNTQFFNDYNYRSGNTWFIVLKKVFHCVACQLNTHYDYGEENGCCMWPT